MQNIFNNITIWGGGLIGYTLAQALADKNIPVIIIDNDYEVIQNINSYLLPRKELAAIIPLPNSLQKEMISGVHLNNIKPAIGPSIHILSIPTEKNGQTYFQPTKDVIQSILSLSSSDFPVYLIIESTISPNWLPILHNIFQEAGRIHGKDYHIGASPRRDVFNNDDFKIKFIDKVIGGDTPEVVEIMKSLYQGITNAVHVATNTRHAMLTKLAENYLRYTSLQAVNALSHSFPDDNISEVFQLASTKWNIELYHPSLGIGGYCIPLAKEYLADAMADQELADKFRKSHFNELDLFNSLNILIQQLNPKKLGILGLSYAPSFKVHTHSPSLSLIKHLKALIPEILIHDPFYNEQEISALTGCHSLTFPENLENLDLIILMTPHPIYLENAENLLLSARKHDIPVFDNLGALKSFDTTLNTYWEVGTPIKNVITEKG